MGKVWDALKKHEDEQSQKQASVKSEAVKEQPHLIPAQEETVTPASCFNGKGYSPILVSYQDPGGIYAEQYRSLRTNVLAKPQQKSCCLLITSAEAKEGKTVTTLNLAFVLAELPDIRVLVVDGDLRKADLTTLLRVHKTPGLVDFLRGASTLKEVIQPTLCPNLDVISSGVAHRNELGEILSRIPTSKIISDLRRQYDCVLIDTPPVSGVSDTGVWGRAVGEALMIIRMNKTHRESVQRSIGLLRAADVKILGLFLTYQKSYVPKYLYRYY
jgi:capsular exopolysaccharide synthesis family protein